jgi:hypothetical protein
MASHLSPVPPEGGEGCGSLSLDSVLGWLSAHTCLDVSPAAILTIGPRLAGIPTAPRVSVDEGVVTQLPGAVGAPGPHAAITLERKTMAEAGSDGGHPTEFRFRHLHRLGLVVSGAVTQLPIVVLTPTPRCCPS